MISNKQFQIQADIPLRNNTIVLKRIKVKSIISIKNNLTKNYKKFKLQITNIEPIVSISRIINIKQITIRLKKIHIWFKLTSLNHLFKNNNSIFPNLKTQSFLFIINHNFTQFMFNNNKMVVFIVDIN